MFLFFLLNTCFIRSDYLNNKNGILILLLPAKDPTVPHSLVMNQAEKMSCSQFVGLSY